MHTPQPEVPNSDRKIITSDQADASKDQKTLAEEARDKDKDTVTEKQRFDRRKRQQNEYQYHSLSPRRHNSTGNRFGRGTGHRNNVNRHQQNPRNNNVQQQQQQQQQQHFQNSNTKPHHLDSNNNSKSSSSITSQPLSHKPNGSVNYGYKAPIQKEYQDGGKKPLQQQLPPQQQQQQQQQQLQKPRFTTKSSQTGNFEQTAYTKNAEGELTRSNSAPNGVLDEVTTRKYTTEFLKNVGSQYNINAVLPLHSPHLQRSTDSLDAIRMAFGHNTHNYVSLCTQQQQHYAQQNLAQLQQQAQALQRAQMFHQGNNNNMNSYSRGVTHNNRTYNGSSNNSNNSTNKTKEPEFLTFTHQAPQSLDSRSFQNPQYHQSQQQQHSQLQHSQSNVPFNNCNRNRFSNNRSEVNYTDRNKNRPQLNGVNGRNDRNKKLTNEQQQQTSFDQKNSNRLMAVQSEGNEQLIRRQMMLSNGRAASEEYQHRSLSPTPPSSVKSASPGLADKSDDSESTASASSGPSALSVSSDLGKEPLLSAADHLPVLITPTPKEQDVRDVNSWLHSSQFEKPLGNGLSLSAEHLNIIEPPAMNVKRPVSVTEIPTGYIHRVGPRQLMNLPSYDPAYPFDYYFGRSEQTEMRVEPKNLKCNSVWDGLSKQMWDKFQQFQQTRDTYRNKMILWRDLYDSLKDYPPFRRTRMNWGVFLVGSTISGFGLNKSDIDMCLVHKNHPIQDARTEAVIMLNTLKNYLINSKTNTFQGFYLINAKVPILRFRDSTNTIEVDLNFNNCIGVRNTHLLHCYAQLDWRLRPLAIIVKLWAQYHNINDARNSTISSYSLVLMVIHFLQYALSKPVLPCLHKMYPDKFVTAHDIMTIDMMETLDTDYKSENKQPLGELLLRFLDYYSNFDFVKNAISIRTGGVLPVEVCKNLIHPKNDPNHWQTLCIEEPFDLTNTARSTYDGDIFKKVKEVFFHSFRRLKEYKTLEALFQSPLFTHQQIQPQFHQTDTQPMKCVVYNQHSTQSIISTGSINTEIVS